MHSLRELTALSAQLPSMGGKEIGAFLRRVARDAPQGSAIVEVGCWLGAGTAQLALGVRERAAGDTIPIIAYDRWVARESEVEKASKQAGLSFIKGMDTLP